MRGLDQALLIGYWPLLGGRGGDFIDFAGHSIQDVSGDSPNVAARGLYGLGTYDWVRKPALWTLALCGKGYLYHAPTDSCLRRKETRALYMGQAAVKVSAPASKQLTTWANSLSIWVYHTDFNASSKLMSVADAVHLTLEYTAGTPSFKLILTYGAYSSPVHSFYDPLPALDKPTIGRWIHYGSITTCDIGCNTTFLVNDAYYTGTITGTLPTLPTTPTPLIFGFGEFLIGFVREAKFWRTALTVAEMWEARRL